MRGRRPKPTHLKLVTGTLRKHRQPNAEPRPEGDLLHCPDWFTESQRQGWTYAIASAPRGLLKRIDRGLLVVYVVAEDEVYHCSLKISEVGLVVVSKQRGAVTNPFVRIRRMAMLTMLRAAAELGFTPASRSRIELMPDATPDDEWDAIFEDR